MVNLSQSPTPLTRLGLLVKAARRLQDAGILDRPGSLPLTKALSILTSVLSHDLAKIYNAVFKTNTHLGTEHSQSSSVT